MNSLCFVSNLTSAEWAAWVQAGSAILAFVISSAALYISVTAPRIAERKAAERDRRDRVGRIESIREMNRHLRRLLNELSVDQLNAQGWPRANYYDRLARTERACEAIPLHEQETTTMVEVIISMQAALATTLRVAPELEKIFADRTTDRRWDVLYSQIPFGTPRHAEMELSDWAREIKREPYRAKDRENQAKKDRKQDAQARRNQQGMPADLPS